MLFVANTTPAWAKSLEAPRNSKNWRTASAPSSECSIRQLHREMKMAKAVLASVPFSPRLNSAT